MVNFARGRECFVSLSILLVSDSKVSRGAAPAAVGEPPARPGGKLPGAGGPARQPETLALPRHSTQALVAFGGWSGGNDMDALSI